MNPEERKIQLQEFAKELGEAIDKASKDQADAYLKNETASNKLKNLTPQYEALKILLNRMGL